MARIGNMKAMAKIRELFGYDTFYSMAQRLGMNPTSYQTLEEKSKGTKNETWVTIKRAIEEEGLHKDPWNFIGELMEKEVDGSL